MWRFRKKPDKYIIVIYSSYQKSHNNYQQNDQNDDTPRGNFFIKWINHCQNRNNGCIINIRMPEN
jgi:hypothetical protein